MEKRRLLSETLPPEQQEFLTGSLQNHTPKAEPAVDVDDLPSSRSASKPASNQSRRNLLPRREGLVAITVRLPVSLVEYMDEQIQVNKAARQKPASQQDMVAAALRRWFGLEASA